MITVEETSFIDTDLVIVQMGVPKELWEKISTSEEWQKILRGDVSEKADTSKHADKVDTTINAVCEVVMERDMAPEAYADTVKALAALVEARAKLI